MSDETIITSSAVGHRLDIMTETDRVSYLLFNNSKVKLVEKITIGRSADNDIVIDNKLTSRHHAIVQKIKDEYFLKDDGSTNGTFLNGKKVPDGKYVKLHKQDKVTIGNVHLIIS
ncbi:MAG TPA: FHA domain-containing protein [Treponemataceae bacterium]|nr:FHA domain-containing protein [Treponemataceae bacterium]